MDHVRTNLSHPNNFDILAEVDAQGRVWVDVNAGGISTREVPDGAWNKVWKLRAGASVPAGLEVWNDMPGHWTWDPGCLMLLSDYVAELASVNGSFTRVR